MNFEGFLRLIVIALNGFRAGRAVAMDDIGEPIRRWTRDYSAGDPSSRHRRMMVGLAKCPHCIGFWLTGLFGLIIGRRRAVPTWALIGAASGLQSLMSTFAQEDQIAMEMKEPEPEGTSEAGRSDIVPPEGLIPTE